MTELVCGKSIDFTDLLTVKNAIKVSSLLGRLGTTSLVASSSTATGLISNLQSAIDTGAQIASGDFSAITGLAGEEYSSYISELRDKWGDIYDEFDDYIAAIPSAEQIIAGAEVPDICSLIPNKIRVPNDDGTFEVISLPQVSAIADAAPSREQALTRTVVDKAQNNSENSPATELTRIDVITDYETKVALPIKNYLDSYFVGLTESLIDIRKTYVEDEKWQQILQKAADTGLTLDELDQNGSFTTVEASFYRDYVDNYLSQSKSLSVRRAKIKALVKSYEKTVAGRVPADDFNFEYNKYKVNERVFNPTDAEALANALAIIGDNDAAVINYYKYFNILN